MDAMQAIFERFSYRGMYENTPIPREDLRTILEAGLAAPSGCNTQSTSLIGIDDPEMIKTVGGCLNMPHFASAPAAVCVLTQRIPGHGNTYYNVQDYAAAIENILLAITALGYASCWVEGDITANEAVSFPMSEALGIPSDYRLVAYLPIGKPTGEGRRIKKKPFEERAWFNGFGKG